MGAWSNRIPSLSGNLVFVNISGNLNTYHGKYNPQTGKFFINGTKTLVGLFSSLKWQCDYRNREANFESHFISDFIRPYYKSLVILLKHFCNYAQLVLPVFDLCWVIVFKAVTVWRFFPFSPKLQVFDSSCILVLLELSRVGGRERDCSGKSRVGWLSIRADFLMILMRFLISWSINKWIKIQFKINS